jgi:tetratricopeptide (TPR) repeat protein/pimeloyl-ACP methyl ester carboxylesterase
VRVEAVPGKDVVVLQIANGPALCLRPENARDLMKAQTGARRSPRGKTAKEAADTDEIVVPAQLQWQGLETTAVNRGVARGFLGDVRVSAVQVLTDVAADLTAEEVVKRVDDQVTPGVYVLSPDALPSLKDGPPPINKIPAGAGGPILVLIHGCFSTTSRTFHDLWTEHPQLLRSLFEHYGGHVYALDHATMGVSPISNAVMLAEALPKNARVHLLTHSRGGLVAEVLARVCANPDLTGADVEFFEDDGAKDELRDLKRLAKVVSSNKPLLERVVRVACPARGTLWASKRLDAYLSVFKWSLELAGIPVAPALVDFLSQVAQRRADWKIMPGLAAQIPDSPLVKWLHAVDEAIPGELRVVAGDAEGDSVLSWTKTLLADSFFWTDNDLVVQTRSMYGGTPRALGGRFVLDQGGKVSHFKYFHNKVTASAIVAALKEDEPRDFRPIGPESYAGRDSSGFRARLAREGKAPEELPAVFLLPGGLGSNLKVDGKRVWLGWRIVNGLMRLKYDPNSVGKVEPDGFLSLYEDIAEYLSRTHEVIPFPFDWRRPIEEEARRLAEAVQDALAAREQSAQPVRMVAHSMGGLLARVMQLERPDVWKRMLARTGSRILMLGTPNGGCWAPMQVLSGDDTIGNALVAFGAPFQDHAARELVAQFPGFIQVQAGLLDGALGLNRHETWKQLAAGDLARVEEHNWWHCESLQLLEYGWGVPSQEVLDQAVELRKRLDAQRDKDLGDFSDKIVHVVGQAPFTPDGYQVRDDEGLVYLDAQESGDGRVTLASALLPGVRTWKLDCAHGDLPDKDSAFDAYRELLEGGTTDRLPALAVAPSMPAPSHAANRPSRGRSEGRPPTNSREILAPPRRDPGGEEQARGTRLRISVINGDLTFVHRPLLLGHYHASRLTGTERVMNGLVGGAMQASLDAGLYPAEPGTHQIFLNRRGDPDYPLRLPRPEAVVVAGLGAEGKLKANELVKTVRQAVIAWAQREAEKPSGAPAHFEIAATLLGSGGAGISPGQAAQLIADGVREANERLAEGKWPWVSHVHLIELYLDRATEAWRALSVQADTTPAHYQVTELVQPGAGALRRTLDSGYRGADYDLISVVSENGEEGGAEITYTLDTKRARTEVRAQSMQGSLLKRLIASASNDPSNDNQIGRTLFKLLVPVEVEPFLGGSTEMLIELDPGTAGIPWELLDSDIPGSGDHRPWAIRSKLIRKLRIEDFRSQVHDAETDERVLVIGEPLADAKTYPALPGALAEARAVAKRLTAHGALGADRVTQLFSPEDSIEPGPDARKVITTLMSQNWRIVHIAGHGEPPELVGPEPKTCDDPPQTDGNPRGVVLSDCCFLGPLEIKNMRVVPELVFVNCCHLAARNAGQLLRREGAYNRPRFAASVAEALIRIGVRCVIAAGWAVDDTTANAFATRFYEAILRGRRFIDAVAEARNTAQQIGGNTWAAYQCYGDPDWVFRREGGDANRPPAPLGEIYAGVASRTSLEIALETLAVQSVFQGAREEEQRAKLRYLEEQFGKRWDRFGSTAEAFARAWAAVGDKSKAIEWYEKALAADDGSASIKASEQLANLRARLAVESLESATEALDKLKEALKKIGTNKAKKAAHDAVRRKIPAAQKALSAAKSQGAGEIAAALKLLERLVALHPSMERESLLGSTYKRLAMFQTLTGKNNTAAVRKMKQHYALAERLGRSGKISNVFYPAINRIAAELVLDAGKSAKDGGILAALAPIKQILELKARDDPEFWGAAGLVEVMMYEAIANRNLAGQLGRIEAELKDLHARVQAKQMWSSVYDQARFILGGYGPRASGPEKAAAKTLLEVVGKLTAGGRQSRK